MTLTTKMLYKIAEKMLEDEEVIRLSKDPYVNLTLRKAAIFVLQNAGGYNELFKECGLGDELHLRENGGRIYCYVVNMWDMRTSKTVPITDSILKDFELTEDGEVFVKKYL